MRCLGMLCLYKQSGRPTPFGPVSCLNRAGMPQARASQARVTHCTLEQGSGRPNLDGGRCPFFSFLLARVPRATHRQTSGPGARLRLTEEHCTRSHEGHHHGVECRRDMAVGHTRRRRLRHLPGSLRRHVSHLQIPRRRLQAACVNPNPSRPFSCRLPRSLWEPAASATRADCLLPTLCGWPSLQFLENADIAFTWFVFPADSTPPPAGERSSLTRRAKALHT